MYDFHKIRNGDHYSENKAEFRHEFFFREGFNHLNDIKRKGFKEKELGTIKKNTKNPKKHFKKKSSKKTKNIKKSAPSETSIRKS